MSEVFGYENQVTDVFYPPKRINHQVYSTKIDYQGIICL